MPWAAGSQVCWNAQRKLWVKPFLGTVWASVCQERVCQKCLLWQCGWWQQKRPADGSSWLHSSRGLSWTIKAKSVLHVHLYRIVKELTLLASLLGWRRLIVLGDKLEDGPQFLIWGCCHHWYGSWKAHVCWELLWLSSSGPFCCLWHERQLLWASSKQWTKSQLELARSPSLPRKLRRLRRLSEYYSPIPATPVLISGGRMVSELLVSIDHLSLIVKDWLMITMHHKTFRRKGECFVDHLFLCVAV